MSRILDFHRERMQQKEVHRKLSDNNFELM